MAVLFIFIMLYITPLVPAYNWKFVALTAFIQFSLPLSSLFDGGSLGEE